MQMMILGDDSETAAERKALLTLFWCTAGPGWIQKRGWQDGDSDLVEWCGIGVDPNDNGVTLVDLRRNGLAGAMPPEIGDLQRLRHLFLGDNDLQGSIPSSIGQLSHLCILSLRGNNLKGEIVPELGDLSVLQTLSLRDNRLTGTIPPKLGQLTCLRHLFLNNNNLTGPIPDELSKLTQLEQLFLGDNDLEGPIPASLPELVRLEELVLSGNQLSGSVPPELSVLTSLIRLELDGNNFTGDIPHELSALSNLKVLYLNNNGLSGPIPSELGMLSWLERLDLSENKLTGGIPPELGQLFSLQLLMLNNNRLIGGIPCELGRLHHIDLLLLDGNLLSEAPPIVGGKGLRQWQIAQRKAFLNGWSMMDRLTFLEYENARLMKENDLLRKSIGDGWQRCPVFLDRESSRPSSSTSASPVTNSPHAVFLSPTSPSPVPSSSFSPFQSPQPPIVNVEAVSTIDPGTVSASVALKSVAGPSHCIPSSSPGGPPARTVPAPQAYRSQDSDQSIASLPPLTPREGMEGRGRQASRGVEKDKTSGTRPPRDSSAVGVGKGLRSLRGKPFGDEAEHVSRSTTDIGRGVTIKPPTCKEESRDVGPAVAGVAVTRRLRSRASHGGAEGDRQAVDENEVLIQKESGKESVGGVKSAQTDANGSPSTAPSSPVGRQDGGENTGSASPGDAPAGNGEVRQQEMDSGSSGGGGGGTESQGRSWASLIGMTSSVVPSGVGAGVSVREVGLAARGRNPAESGGVKCSDQDSPEGRSPPLAMQSPLSQMVLGLFRVGPSEGSSTAGVVNSTDGRSPASPTEQGDKLGSRSDVSVIASPE